MAVFGYATGGASGASGPSTLFTLLPFANYRDPLPDGSRAWVEEFVDAIGIEFDILRQRFITNRANLIDPTYTPSPEIANATTATATAAPTAALITDTMLDVLCYVSGIPTPVDTNLTIAQKQALVVAGWDFLRRKGTRIRLLKMASLIGEGVCIGSTVVSPAGGTNQVGFSVTLPDGAPTPGWGTWVPSSSGVDETTRPWIIATIRSMIVSALLPAWAAFGTGYSQWRAGFSGAGELAGTTGARLNLLAHEHFDAWTGSVPNGWTNLGATLIQGNSGVATYGTAINFEFSTSFVEIDLTAAAAGQVAGVSQSGIVVNNQITHRFDVDYMYQQLSGPLLNQLTCRITDETNTNYYNPTTKTWSSAVYDIPIPVSPSFTRGRYAFDVVMQPASAATSTQGTRSVAIRIAATSDGTAATQTKYAIYRAGLYEKFDQTIEMAAGGERTLWQPLVDAPGTCTITRAASGSSIVEAAVFDRSSYKVQSATTATFPYHPAITARGYASNSRWTNLLSASNSFGVSDGFWAYTNANVTAANQISPQIGETVATAPRLNATNTGALISQAALVADPSSKSYIAGVWVKKITADVSFTDVTLTLNAVGGVTSVSRAYTLKVAQGWQLLAMPSVTFVAGDAAHALKFTIAWGAAFASGQIAVASSYVYDVTGKTDVLYPPVCQTPIGGTGYVAETNNLAIISGANKHALTLRQLTTLASGQLNFTIVPTFGAGAQPNATIFDFGQSTTQNRLVLKIASGTLTATLIDNGSTSHTATVTLSGKVDPAAGSCTWQRDIAIPVRVRWSNTTGIDLAVGNGAARQVSSLPWTTSDASLAGVATGNDIASLNPFDGTIRALEIIQIGSPS